MIGAQPFTKEQENQLLDWFSKKRYPERNRAILIFGIQTGFRISEILSLVRKDVEKAGKVLDSVYVRKVNMKGGKGAYQKGVTGRSMMMTKKTREAIRLQLDAIAKKGFTDPNDFLFQSMRGENKPLSVNGFWRLLWKSVDWLGLSGRISTHSMRKTFAGRIHDKLLEDKNPDNLRILQNGLGHANINNTIKYISFKEEGLNNAINDVFD